MFYKVKGNTLIHEMLKKKEMAVEAIADQGMIKTKTDLMMIYKNNNHKIVHQSMIIIHNKPQEKTILKNLK